MQRTELPRQKKEEKIAQAGVVLAQAKEALSQAASAEQEYQTKYQTAENELSLAEAVIEEKKLAFRSGNCR